MAVLSAARKVLRRRLSPQYSRPAALRTRGADERRGAAAGRRTAPSANNHRQRMAESGLYHRPTLTTATAFETPMSGANNASTREWSPFFRRQQIEPTCVQRGRSRTVLWLSIVLSRREQRNGLLLGFVVAPSDGRTAPLIDLFAFEAAASSLMSSASNGIALSCHQ